jgi:16S rRNA processing protein RimM
MALRVPGMVSEWLPFGVLRRPHGTSGEILLHLFNSIGAQKAGLVPPARVRLTQSQGFQEVDIVACRPMQEGFLVRIDGFASREAAATLVGQEIHLPRTALGPVGEAEFYVEDIVGCEVFQSDGKLLGRVRGTFWNGAQDVMTIVDDDGGERLLPVVPEYVRRFDSSPRRLIVDLLHE